jgi:hypothetical protein
VRLKTVTDLFLTLFAVEVISHSSFLPLSWK